MQKKIVTTKQKSKIKNSRRKLERIQRISKIGKENYKGINGGNVDTLRSEILGK